MKNTAPLISVGRIENSIFLIRGERVMLDSDLAELYQIETKFLNRAVKRNLKRFPPDFMFQLNSEEAASFEVPIWHLTGQGRPPLPAVRIH